MKLSLVMTVGIVVAASITLYSLKDSSKNKIGNSENAINASSETFLDISTGEIVNAEFNQAVSEIHKNQEVDYLNQVNEHSSDDLNIVATIISASNEYFSSQNSLLMEEKRKEIILGLAENPEAVSQITSVYEKGIGESSDLHKNQAEIRLIGIRVLDQVQKNGNEKPILASIQGVNNRILAKDATKGLELDFRDLVSAWSSNRYQHILDNPDIEISKLGSEIGNLDEMANGFLSGMTKSVPKEVLWPFLNDHIISAHLPTQGDS